MTARGLHIRQHGDSYVLWRGDERLTGDLSWRQVRQQMARVQKREREAAASSMRKCLCCPTMFMSEGPHHRLCNYHRATIGGHDRQMVG